MKFGSAFSTLMAALAAATSTVAQPNCMQDNYLKDPKNNQNLVCAAKEVFLVDLAALTSTVCTQGSKVTLSLNGTVNFNADRYDPGWYIATDGGNALTGQCVSKVLLQGETGTNFVADRAMAKGSVKWDSDKFGGNDKCGDVIINGGGGGQLKQTNIARDLTVVCDDKDNAGKQDGTLDISICFSWRQPGGDDFCNPMATYPGAPSKCFCTQFPVKQVTVVKPPTKSPTKQPTKPPTKSPTKPPTKSPTMQPTLLPTMQPTLSPTMQPTLSPTMHPTMAPTCSTCSSSTCSETKPCCTSPDMCITVNCYGEWFGTRKLAASAGTCQYSRKVCPNPGEECNASTGYCELKVCGEY
jgi:hypothetical protein